ncbi:MAG: NAD-dependent epimerase/dehydratase family protein [Jatrophihabitans sp.]
MKIVLTGASGLIGPALRTALRSHGHEVLSLVRREPAGPDEARWDPGAGRLAPELLVGADAVVCLSGVGVGDKRWTEKYKKQIVASRVDSVGTWLARWRRLAAPRSW